MLKKLNLFNLQLISKKYPIYLILIALLGIAIYASCIILFGFNFNQMILFTISLTLLSISISKGYIFLYKKNEHDNMIKSQNMEVLKEKKRAEILLDVGQICSWQYSTKAGILKFNSSGHKILGRTKSYYIYEELIRNRHLKRIIHKTQDQGLLFIDEEAYFPIINRWVIIRGRCVDTYFEEKPNQFIGIVLDNTERRETLRRLENISVTDELTGLKNRRFFFESLNKELSIYKRHKKVFSIAMIDLDHFKKINDTYGHLAGDFVLKSFSKLLVSEMRPYDLISRFGGEEFIILLPDINKIEATSIINRVRKKLHSYLYTYNNNSISFTFSCGIGDVTEINLYTENEFITIIDTRLYRAKNSGRNLVVSGG